METDNNIFSKLKGLLWGAFLGVVSFQLLAPKVWGYVNEAMGLENKAAYWVFIIVYFVLLPLGFAIWLLANKATIFSYLSLNNANAVEKKEGKSLYVLAIFVLAQIVFLILGFFTHWGPVAIGALFIGYALCSLVLLLFCYRLCNKKIGASSSCSPAVMGSAKKYLSQMFFFSVMFFVIFFTATGCFLHNWIKVKDQKHTINLSAFNAGNRAFELESMSHAISKKITDCGNSSDNYNYTSIGKDLDTIHIQLFNSNCAYYLPAGKAEDTIWINHPNTTLRLFVDTVNMLGKQLNTILDSISNGNPDSVSICSINHITIRLDSLYFFDTARLSKDDNVYVGILKTSLVRLSKRIDKVTKNQLGLQLRSVQAKGLVMFIGLFFTILALYIFIGTIQKIQILELEELRQNKRIDAEQLEAPIIDKENEVADSTSISNNLWLFLTILAWLMVPILKLVKDEEINLKKPYQSFTLNNALANTDRPKGLAAAPVVYYIQPHRDTLWLVDSLHSFSLEQIKQMIRKVDTNVNSVRSNTDYINQNPQ